MPRDRDTLGHVPIRFDLPAWITRDDPTLADAERCSLHLQAFRVCLLAHVCVQAWAWAIVPPPPPFAFPVVPIHLAAVVLSLCFAAGLAGRDRLACAVAMPVVWIEVLSLLPFTPNHVFLSAILTSVVVAFDDEDADEGRAAIGVLRWIAVVIFVWAGVQKLLHGLYFRGEFLAWMIAHGVDRWSTFFSLVVPADEIARLEALPRFVPGSGPYRVASPLFVALSNSVWLGEIAIGIAALFRRTRVVAGIAAIALVFAIQSAPREFMFALLYTSLLLFMLPGEPNRRFQWGFVLIYGLVLAALLGAPFDFLLKAEGTL